MKILNENSEFTEFLSEELRVMALLCRLGMLNSEYIVLRSGEVLTKDEIVYSNELAPTLVVCRG